MRAVLRLELKLMCFFLKKKLLKVSLEGKYYLE